ncbi:hypothetical protein PNOK_0810800 [Pyrrhoderma noxium]|uniref:RING-type domain-containing protein n=1 Tax=Pyrrhoderma noxium TaxID=2282107 RepID=A0A286UA81_9AGAM|nr:hypothetical protein PNOK_0810800 [Pyrrhoderma noxium]
MAEQPQEQSMPTWTTMSEQADPLPGPTTLATHTRGPRYSRSRSSRSNTNSNANSAASSRSVSRSRVESNPLNDHVNLVGGGDELDQTTNDLGTELDVEIPDNMDVDDNAYDDEDEDAEGEDYIFDDGEEREEHANSPRPPLSLPGEVHSTEGVSQSEHSTTINDDAGSRSLLTDLIQCRTSITDNVVSNNTHSPIHLPVDPGSSTQPAYTHNRSNSSSSSHKMHLDSILSPTTPHSNSRGNSGHNSSQNKYDVNDIGSSMAGADIIELYDTPSSLGKRRANTFISDGNNEIASFDLTQDTPDVQILDHKGKSSNSQDRFDYLDLVDDVDSSYVQASSQEKKGKGKEKEEEPPFSMVEFGEGSSGGKKRRIEIDDTKFDNSLLPKGPEEEEGEESWSLRDVPTTHDFHTIDPSTIAGPSTLPYPSESHSPDKSSPSRKKKRHDARVKSKSKSSSPHRNVISLLSSPTIPSSPINIYHRQPESATLDDVIDLVSPVRSSHPIEILPSPPATNNKRAMITSTTTGSSSSSAASSAAVAVTTPTTTTTVTTTTTTTTAAATTAAAASSQVQTTPPKPKQPIHTSQPISEFCCPICFCSPTNATLTLCGHVFCGPCLFAAVRAAPQSNVYQPAGTPPKCPVCRAPMTGWDGRGEGLLGLRCERLSRFRSLVFLVFGSLVSWICVEGLD